jgi:GNAT superfamily N-acetyltransferase
MRFRSDWLRRVLTVPYLPILGPVHPDLVDATLLDEVLAATLAGFVLPFDKASRWTSRPQVIPLVDEIVHEPDHTIIPVLAQRSGGVVTLYYYGTAHDLPQLRTIARRVCRTHGAADGNVVVLDLMRPAAEGQTTRILLKDFASGHLAPQATSQVTELHDDDLPAFHQLAALLADHGFGHLARRITSGTPLGPVLVAREGAQLVGAIGPLTLLRDRRGATMLLPQYFGVLHRYQGRGHGRALWRAATAWGHQRGAAYQLLQTQPGQASDRLFLAEGLHTLGFATKVAA